MFLSPRVTTICLTVVTFSICGYCSTLLKMKEYWYFLVYSNIFLIPSVYLLHVKLSEGRYVEFIFEYLVAVCLFVFSSLYHVWDSSYSRNWIWKNLQLADFYTSYLMICFIIMHFASIRKIWLKLPSYSVAGALVITVCSLNIHDTNRIVLSLTGALSFVVSRYLYICYTKGCSVATKDIDWIDFICMWILIIVACIGQFYIKKPYWLIHSFLWHFGIQWSAYFAVESQYKEHFLLFFKRVSSREDLSI